MRDLLYSIKNGLQSNLPRVINKTLKKIENINFKKIDDRRIIHLISDMLEYYMSIETKISLKKNAFSTFTILLPYNFGYLVHKAYTKKEMKKIGSLCRLYYNLSNNSDKIIKPHYYTILSLEETISVISKTNLNTIVYAELFNFIWRLALHYPDKEIHDLFYNIALKSNVLKEYYPDIIDDFFNKINAVIDLQKPSTTLKLVEFKNIVKNRFSMEQNPTQVSVESNQFEQETIFDLDIFRKRIENCYDNKNLECIKLLLIELDKMRLNVLPSQINILDKLKKIIFEIINNLKSDDKMINTTQSKQIKFKDRMDNKNSLFEI